MKINRRFGETKIWRWSSTFSGIIAFLVVLLVYKSFVAEPTEKIKVVKGDSSKVETRIKGKETQIKIYEKAIDSSQQIIIAINSEIARLKYDLIKFKSNIDTIPAIRIRDTLINKLTIESEGWRSISYVKDTMITFQRYIINSKDTLIAIKQEEIVLLQKDNKKQKRHKRISLLLNGILTTLLIVK